MAHRNMASWAIWTLLAFFLVLFGCSSPDHTEPATDSGIAPDTFVADSGVTDTIADATLDTNIDARICEAKQACSTEGATCGDLQCKDGTWQNVKSDSGTDSGADTFVPDSSADTDAGTDTADSTPPPDTFDSGTPETIVDSGSPDSGTPDTGTPDSGPGDTGTPDTGFDAGPPKTLTCTTPVRDVAFDSFKPFGGAVEGVGHIWSVSATSVFHPVWNGGKAELAHRKAGTWFHESIMDSTETAPPGSAIGIWGTTEDDLCVAANFSSSGTLRCKMGGVWKIDSTQPTTGVIGDFTGVSATEKFMVGRRKSPDVLAVWKGTGSSWSALPALPSSDWFVPGQLYAPGSGKVVLGGYDIDSISFVEKQLAMYVYDGTAWSKLLAPSGENLVLGGAVHGTSINEIWIGGRTSGMVGKVCKVSGLTTWTCWSSSTTVNIFTAVYSPWSGAVLTVGEKDPIAPGAGRFMTIDFTTGSPAASTIDSSFQSAYSVWRAPGTNSYFMNHSGKTGAPGGFYDLNCD